MNRLSVECEQCGRSTPKVCATLDDDTGDWYCEDCTPTYVTIDDFSDIPLGPLYKVFTDCPPEHALDVFRLWFNCDPVKVIKHGHQWYLQVPEEVRKV